jgi:hypothetical protein
MNPKHFHTPVSTRLRCPVCHQPVYSRGGIHPQCAMRQSEPPLPQTELSVIGEHAAEPELVAAAVVTAKVKAAPVKVAAVKPRPAAAISGGSKHAR